MGTLLRNPHDPSSKPLDVPPEQVDTYLGQGYVPVSVEERAGEVTQAAADARANERGALGTANAALSSGLSGLTLGGSDVLLRGVLDKGQFARLRAEREGHPIADLGGNLVGATVGALATGGESLLARSPAAGVAGLGARIARVGEGAGALRALGAKTAGGIVEGSLYGGGTGVSELALSEDPLTFERAASVLSSNALYGGAAGGGISLALGAGGRLVESGLRKARGALQAVADRGGADVALSDDLAALVDTGDRAGLRTAEKLELEAIEAGRVPQRQQLADEIAAHRQATKDDKIWLATKKGGEGAEAGAGAESSAAAEAPASSSPAIERIEIVNPGGVKPDVEIRTWRAGASEPEVKMVSKNEFGRPEYREVGDAVDASLPTGFRAGGWFSPSRAGGVETGFPAPGAIKENTVYVIRPSEILEASESRGVTLTGDELQPDNLPRIGEAWKEGKKLEPITLNISPDGRIHIEDGNHRLATAALDDRPVAVTFRQRDGWAPGFKPEIGDRIRGLLPEKPPAGAAAPSGPARAPVAAKLSADDARAIREIGKISLEADKLLDRTLRNPKSLAESPKRALAALQQQEHALERLAGKSDALRLTFAADQSGARAAALDAVPAALERNRALQARIAELTAAPISARLGQIAAATDRLAAGTPAKSLSEQLLGGSAFSAGAGAVRTVAGALAAVPVLGPLAAVAGAIAAPLVGAKAATIVGEKVFGRMAKSAADAAARTERAVASFLALGRKASPAAAPIASHVLAAVRYADNGEKPPAVPRGKNKARSAPAPAPTLTAAFKARAAEITSQVAVGPDGTYSMRPEAREKVADRLSPIRAVAPVLADRLETQAARRLEFLAAKLPKRPDVFGMHLGADYWQPSDMEMRSFARHAAAIEDPGAIEERLAHGTITPEDADVMRSVYPERLAELTRQIVTQLPTLQKQLPYARRLSLSILTGVAVDPAMDPQILAVLQGQFSAEPNTGGGTQAPRAQAAFGSVTAEQPTKSQDRAADQEV